MHEAFVGTLNIDYCDVVYYVRPGEVVCTVSRIRCTVGGTSLARCEACLSIKTLDSENCGSIKVCV